MHRYGPGRGWSVLDALTLVARDRVRRRLGRLGGWPLAEPYCDGGGGGGGGSGDPELTDELKASDPNKYWQLYWKKESGAAAAFASRDETKRRLAELDDLKKTGLTAEQRKEYDDLKAAAAAADDDKKKKAGEYETLRATLVKKHTDEITARDQRLETLEREIAEGEVRRAILAETDYFGGGENSKSVLVGDMAVRQLRDHVRYEEYDFGGTVGKKKVLIVRDAHGDVITDKNGRPAPFKEAVEPLIASLPEKDHILRGSGKSGSGASGGSGNRNGSVDFNNLTSEQMQDPKIRAAAKQRTAEAGGIVNGRAWERTGDKT